MVKNKNSNEFSNWFRLPGSWLSLLAIIISLITFYILNIRSGTLEVQLPEDVGIKLNVDSTVDVLVPAVFYNTGSPRSQRIVTSIKSTLTDNLNQKISLYWTDTQDFIGAAEFESKYPDKISPGVKDYIIYKSRSVPFIVPGGDSEFKILHLVPEESKIAIKEFSSFELTLNVKTSDENFTMTESYSSNIILSPDEYAWFKKSED